MYTIIEIIKMFAKPYTTGNALSWICKHVFSQQQWPSIIPFYSGFNVGIR